jgi:hypothetical protein
LTERERKLKKRIQLVVACAVSLFFCLTVILAVQLAVRGNQRTLESSLRATQSELQKQIENNEYLQDYYMSQKFIEEYALKVLGYGRNGAKIFEN